MNSFTDKQLKVVRSLAGFYWTETLGPALAGIPEEHKKAMLEAYVSQIITGLIFDDYWDRFNLNLPES